MPDPREIQPLSPGLGVTRTASEWPQAAAAPGRPGVAGAATAGADLPAATPAGVRPVVLISGGSGGIGSATARRFAAGGWRVVITDRDAAALGALATEIGGGNSGGIVLAHPADLRSVEACRGAVAATVAATGRLDCLVNTAGLWTEGPADQTTEDEWDRVLDVNLKGLYFLTSAAIPHLERVDGAVVNLSSDAGVQGNAGAAVYCASKGAVTNLTRALALELAPRGVRVNAVCPGDVATPMIQYQAQTFGGGDPEGYLRDLLSAYPQKERARFIEAGEVAELIWFLSQPTTSAITGANISIDLGLSAGI